MSVDTAAVSSAYAQRPHRIEAEAAQEQRPEERGRTEIADRVVEKVAVQALREVGHAGGPGRRWFGVRFGAARGQDAPRVTAHRHGQMTTLEMTVSVRYPAPVRQVTRRLREHVSHRVQDLTGLTVRQVDIEIARLVCADEPLRTGPE